MRNLLQWLRRKWIRLIALIPTWTTLRTLGNSKVLRSAYFWLLIVPIAARLLSQLSRPLHVSLFGHTHAIHLDLPFSWYCFYFAAVAFSIASFLYSVSCPSPIKEFSSFQDYYQAGNGARRLRAILKHAVTKFSLSVEAVGIELKAALQRSQITGLQVTVSDPFEEMDVLESPFKLEYFAALRREELGDLFYVATRACDRGHLVIRALTSLFYLIGFALTLVVLFQSFRFVVDHLRHG